MVRDSEDDENKIISSQNLQRNNGITISKVANTNSSNNNFIIGSNKSNEEIYNMSFNGIKEALSNFFGNDYNSFSNTNHLIQHMIGIFSEMHSSIEMSKFFNIHYWLWNVRSLNNMKFNYLTSLLDCRTAGKRCINLIYWFLQKPG
jgi:hypothetical protein